LKLIETQFKVSNRIEYVLLDHCDLLIHVKYWVVW